MCQSGRRPVWSCEGAGPGMDEGGGRQSPKVQGALREPPQASQGIKLTLGLGVGLGLLQELHSSFSGGGPRR